ncbi:hypothetical protein D7193_18520 [Micromonospora costi]|uniref:Uncharacterized protein n=1 Tax=Micromonospora costi TaxID=1530042 RepID=A0A3B0A0S0_9ACTN|nr:hypothetical protein D7193_18520 [Micromonospora costi]
MMSAIRDVPERPVPATKIGEGEGMASSQTFSPAPVQAIYPRHPLLRAGPAPAVSGACRTAASYKRATNCRSSPTRRIPHTLMRCSRQKRMPGAPA